MGKAWIILTALFVLTLSSGVVAGMFVSRRPVTPSVAPGAGTRAAPRTPLAAELDLSPAQSEQMRAVWEGVRDRVDDCFLRAQAAQRQRDAAIVALLTDEQKAKLAASQQEYDNAIAALKAERDAVFQDAVK